MLESWYAHVAAVVAAHGGDVVKFTGDSLLILWPFARAAGSDEAARRAVVAGALRCSSCCGRIRPSCGRMARRRPSSWWDVASARERRRGAAVDAAALAAAAARRGLVGDVDVGSGGRDGAPRDGSRMGKKARAVAPLPRRQRPRAAQPGVGDAAQRRPGRRRPRHPGERRPRRPRRDARDAREAAHRHRRRRRALDQARRRPTRRRHRVARRRNAGCEARGRVRCASAGARGEDAASHAPSPACTTRPPKARPCSSSKDAPPSFLARAAGRRGRRARRRAHSGSGTRWGTRASRRRRRAPRDDATVRCHLVARAQATAPPAQAVRAIQQQLYRHEALSIVCRRSRSRQFAPPFTKGGGGARATAAAQSIRQKLDALRAAASSSRLLGASRDPGLWRGGWRLTTNAGAPRTVDDAQKDSQNFDKKFRSELLLKHARPLLRLRRRHLNPTSTSRLRQNCSIGSTRRCCDGAAGLPAGADRTPAASPGCRSKRRRAPPPRSSRGGSWARGGPRPSASAARGARSSPRR